MNVLEGTLPAFPARPLPRQDRRFSVAVEMLLISVARASALLRAAQAGPAEAAARELS
jgi:hypothetical protein